MTDLHLIVGNKNYSSWSLRAWLVLTESGLPFTETLVLLDQPGSDEKKRGYSPAGRVPVLQDRGMTIWDSLAITEYVAERVPRVWPEDAGRRARARSLCAEMHSSFFKLRTAMPMNCRATKCPGDRGAGADIARIIEIWTTTRGEFGGGAGFLFGGFCAADAFFAPVASRFHTYQVPLDGVAAEYSEALFGLPSFQRWLTAAESEEATLEEYDSLG